MQHLIFCSCNCIEYPIFSTELVEAAMYLYRATKDPYLLEIGVDMMESIEHSTRTKCGYATVRCFSHFRLYQNPLFVYMKIMLNLEGSCICHTHFKENLFPIA